MATETVVRTNPPIGKHTLECEDGSVTFEFIGYYTIQILAATGIFADMVGRMALSTIASTAPFWLHYIRLSREKKWLIRPELIIDIDKKKE